MTSKLSRCTGLLLLPVAGLMAQPGPPDRVKVLIGFNDRPGASEEALVRAFGGTVKHTFRLIPAIAATLPSAALNALSNHPAVSVIEPDVRVHALGLDEYDNAWGVKKINARTVHTAGNRGLNVKVCVIDSGIDKDHPDLFANYGGGYNFITPGAEPVDDYGHGTHVAGIIAAAANGSGVVGVAPEVKILAYKILDADGNGDFGDAVRALEMCVAAGGVITNNSYGATFDPGTLVSEAFGKAANAGILNVGAAGNATGTGTCNTVSYPAAYDSVIAVGATDSTDKVASYSCRGPAVELAAPGVNISSTYPDNTYATESGTSMASPHVAGLAALIFACGLPDLNGDKVFNGADVRLRLQNTALDLGPAGRDTSFGFGRIRADLAATNCAGAPPPVQPPAAPASLTATGVTRSSVSLAWSDNSGAETNYVVERCAGSGCTAFAAVATLPMDTTSYTDGGLRKATSYRYRVKAINSAGSAASGFVQATTAK